MLKARWQLLGLAAVSTAIALSILFIDRPVALWVNAALYRTSAFVVASSILSTLDGVVVAGLVLLLIAVVGRRLYDAPTWVNRFMAGGSSAVIALLGAMVLKVAVGRSQVYPPFLQHHTYGFRPFAGSEDFMAFPSATMAGVTAFIVGIGFQRRYERAAAAVVVVILAAALIITSSHWLSDIIGGTYLGMVTGAAVAEWLRRRVNVKPQASVQFSSS